MRKSGTTRHTGAALALVPMLAGAEAQGCDRADRAFWVRGEPARVDRCIAVLADLEARGDDGKIP